MYCISKKKEYLCNTSSGEPSLRASKRDGRLITQSLREAAGRWA
jgi:hypothetical protein